MAQQKIAHKSDPEALHLNVVIADDVAQTRESLQMMLELADDVTLVGVAQDGREAVALAQELQPDIVFMDINMPHLDGLSAIELLMAESSELVCIIVSAEKQSETLQRALHVGAKGYLIKPFTAQQVFQVLERARKWLAEKRQVQPAIAPPPAEPLPLDREQLESQARDYARAHRTDDEAVQALETLAADPQCPHHWLQVLAMMYVVRHEWRKLQVLAARLLRHSATEM